LIARSLIAWVLLVSCAFAGNRPMAKPGDGVLLNQQFVLLDDGRFYATHDRRVVPAGQVRTTKEALEARKIILDRLGRQRYWHSGSPPEKDALQRYLEKDEMLKKGG